MNFSTHADRRWKLHHLISFEKQLLSKGGIRSSDLLLYLLLNIIFDLQLSNRKQVLRIIVLEEHIRSLISQQQCCILLRQLYDLPETLDLHKFNCKINDLCFFSMLLAFHDFEDEVIYVHL